MELTRPFAENGDRQDFPVDTQGDGTMSLQQGFGAFYGLPPEEGGLFIDRTKFNQLMFLVSKGVIDNKTAIEALESEYGSLVTSSPKLLTKNLTWNVGSGGDYEDLQTAINEASKYIPIGNYIITIKLKSGYILNKKMSFYSQNLGHVTISSEDDIVQSNASSIATSSGSNAIFLFTNSVAPSFSIIIDCFTSSEDKYITGVALYNNSKGIFGNNYGVKNSKGEGIQVAGNSELYSIGLLLENCKTGILCNKSKLIIPNSKINSCSQYGVRIYDGNICNIINSSFKQTSGTMIQNERGIVYANGVNFNSSSATECNISYNQITSSGIVFK
ncbi:hypothetical protein [Campylobacter jejuni]|uniref:hypothetical protein n=1 Tax=Campylobacter jejuni TaxID=197 RepID=UPI00313D0DA1